MRSTPNLRADSFRKKHPVLGSSPAGTNFGYFEVGPLRVISSGEADSIPDSGGWEHVSVSLPDRCPTWEEMCRVKDLFWRDDETVIQIHPPKAQYVNQHPHCLHLWRKADSEQQLPPIQFV
jgi:hypothetical protein